MRAPLLFLAALSLVACGSTGSTEGNATSGNGASVEELVRPWTPSFTRVSLLLADEIHVEGPKGLLDHIATRVVEPHHRQDVETLPEGFRHEIAVIDPASEVEIRSHLDSMELVALRRLVILERPGDVRVSVKAVGNVYYKPEDGDAVRRPMLELQGAEPR